MMKRKALGKGLSALIPEANDFHPSDTTFFQCPIEHIEPNPYQPRHDLLHDEKMEELVLSIQENGIITPLLVSKKDEGGYRLIAGERRWRAAQKAGLERVPVVVRETTPIESLELAIIENIHRKDLNPIEEALAYHRWLEDTDTTQEVLAKKVGKNRSTITNMLRLLSLPQSVQNNLIDGSLSMGHARVLAGIKDTADQLSLRDQILTKSLSVRQAEEFLKKRSTSSASRHIKKEKGPYLTSLEHDLQRSLGTKVELKRQGPRGTILIHFYSDDEFDRLLEHLT